MLCVFACVVKAFVYNGALYFLELLLMNASLPPRIVTPDEFKRTRYDFNILMQKRSNGAPSTPDHVVILDTNEKNHQTWEALAENGLPGMKPIVVGTKNAANNCVKKCRGKLSAVLLELLSKPNTIGLAATIVKHFHNKIPVVLHGECAANLTDQAMRNFHSFLRVEKGKMPTPEYLRSVFNAAFLNAATLIKTGSSKKRRNSRRRYRKNCKNRN